MTEKSKRNRRARKENVRDVEFRMQHTWRVCHLCQGDGWVDMGEDDPLGPDPCMSCDAEGGHWVRKSFDFDLFGKTYRSRPVEPVTRQMAPEHRPPPPTTVRYFRDKEEQEA